MALRIKTIAHRNADAAFMAAGRKRLDNLFPQAFKYMDGELPNDGGGTGDSGIPGDGGSGGGGIPGAGGPVDDNIPGGDDSPDVVCFLSGGSENAAIASLKPGRFTLLLAGFEDNAYAAAMEVMAWAGNRRFPVMLLSMEEAAKSSLLGDLDLVCGAFRRLAGQRAGLIGEVSHWLVASAVQKDHAKEKLGLDLVHIPWKGLPDYASFPPDPELLEVFRDHGPETLEKEAGILSFLKKVVSDQRLDALTLECFNMVVDQDVTACLSPGLLNSRGFPAGCEGDLVSLAGMMLAKELTGVVPWMANVAAIREGSILFAHCTVPLNLVENFAVHTHFETGKSAAIKGETNMDQVTVFRMNEKLDKAFVAEGKIVSRPSHGFACRTQSEVALSPSDNDKIKYNPLGNHHLLLPGSHKDLLELACRYKGIQVV
jgi:L-fucose isomerase-like protein